MDQTQPVFPAADSSPLPRNTGDHIRISHTCVPGRQHREAGLCQDEVLVRRSPELIFLGIADGRSGAACCGAGARASLEAAADFLREAGIDSLWNAPFPDELPCLILQAVRKRLLSLSRHSGADFREFASTLLAVAAEPKTGRFVLLHLGDGCAAAVEDSGNIRLLSAPENGASPRHTWLTTSSGAVGHLRVTCGSLSHIRRLVLLSDGAQCLCQGKNIPRKARELLRTGSREEILAYLRGSDPYDDASCILADPTARQ